MAVDLSRFACMRREATDYINLNPIQRGGILSSEARETASDWLDGYSVCDFCDGDLHKIKKPPVDYFVNEVLPNFLGTDSVGVTHGARESKYIIMHSMCKPGDDILVDGNAHYSTFVAAERAGLKTHVVESSGHPEYRMDPESYAARIDEVTPALALLTYPDGSYGNLPDAARVGKICAEYNVPFVLNCAYSIGRMPVNAKELSADFVVASGHKSMAASGPVGLLGAKEEYAGIVFRRSEKYKKKMVEMLGCTSRGLPLITLMASFSHVSERVLEWGKEVENARFVAGELEKIEGVTQLGERPTNHDLIAFETPLFHEISKTHKKRGFFLYKELKTRGIVGLKPGVSSVMKLSTYRLNKEEILKIIEAFNEISRLGENK